MLVSLKYMVQFSLNPNYLDRMVGVVVFLILFTISFYYLLKYIKLSYLISDDGIVEKYIFRTTKYSWDDLQKVIIYNEKFIHLIFKERRIKINSDYTNNSLFLIRQLQKCGKTTIINVPFRLFNILKYSKCGFVITCLFSFISAVCFTPKLVLFGVLLGLIFALFSVTLLKKGISEEYLTILGIVIAIIYTDSMTTRLSHHIFLLVNFLMGYFASFFGIYTLNTEQIERAFNKSSP